MWKGHLFFDKVLPMGLRSACLCCQRTTNAVCYIFCTLGFAAVNYLDDFGGCDTAEAAFLAYGALCKLFLGCGLVEAVDKSVLPSTVMDFLGVLLNTITMTLEVTPERLVELHQLLEDWLAMSSATLKPVQSILGKFNFVATCVRPARVFMSRMLNFLRSMIGEQAAMLSKEIRLDILWWYKFLPTYNRVSVIMSEEWSVPDAFLASDACLSGAGGVCCNQVFHAIFSASILALNLHISALEMLTVVVCLKLWGH